MIVAAKNGGNAVASRPRLEKPAKPSHTRATAHSSSFCPPGPPLPLILLPAPRVVAEVTPGDLTALETRLLQFLSNQTGDRLVNKAVNQAEHYISEIERIRDTIRAKYHVDFYKVAAKVVVGTLEPGDTDFEAKRAALRMYNSHLNRVEVITYTDLVARSKSLMALDESVAGLEDSA